MLWDELSVDNSSGTEHLFWGNRRWFLEVFVGEEDNFLDPWLDDHFGAFIAGKKSNIKRAAFHIDAVLVEDCVDFGMTHVHVFVLKRIVRWFRPRECVVIAVDRKSIVAYSDDVFLSVHDTSTNLGRRIFTPLSSKEGNPHEVFFPVYKKSFAIKRAENLQQIWSPK